jgi:hypothetical protein
MILSTLSPGTTDNDHDVYNACRYLLLLFDHPQLDEHLDDVVGGMDWATPGQTGKRWRETICAAAWRVLLTVTESANHGYGLRIAQMATAVRG